MSIDIPFGIKGLKTYLIDVICNSIVINNMSLKIDISRRVVKDLWGQNNSAKRHNMYAKNRPIDAYEVMAQPIVPEIKGSGS